MTRSRGWTWRCLTLQVIFEFDLFQRATADTGIGRTGHDSDMAACTLFLAGPGGLFLNAQVLYPDGGKLK